MKIKLDKKILIISILLMCGFVNETLAVTSSRPTASNVRTLTGQELEISRIRSRYLTYIEHCLRSNWKNPTGNNNNSVAFTIVIDKNGRITAYDYLSQSGVAAYDKSALNTILNTAPFKPIPRELNIDEAEIQVYFNGVEVQASTFSKAKQTRYMPYRVNQANKTCRTIEINQAKDLRTTSTYSSSSPSNLHWEVGRQVQRNWAPPLNSSSAVDIGFTVMPNGSIQNIKFLKRSYNEYADNAAFNTIKNLKIKPFKWDNSGVRIKYSFFVVDNQ